MTKPQTDIQMQLTELSTHAFEAFCYDTSEMFGIQMKAHVSPPADGKVDELQKRFEKPSAVISVNAEGVLNGDLHIIIDRQGLFTLAGTVIILPEQEILDVCKTGSESDAEELHDAVGETGNLLVASWDRIFREEMEGHIRLLKTDTFIGNPWDSSKKNAILSKDEDFLFLPCEITIGSFPTFQCGVVFPWALWRNLSDEAVASVSETDDEPEEARESDPNEQTAEDADSASETPAESEHPEASGGAVSRTIQKMVQSMPVIPPEHAQTLLKVPAEAIMEKEILWGKPEDSVQYALEKMQQTGAACMMVGESSVLQGIVSWLNIAEAVSIYLRPVFSKWRRLEDDATLRIRLKAIMTCPVHTINLHTTLTEIMDDMCRHHCRCLPVVNEEGQVEGLVSAFGIFKLLRRMASDLCDPSPLQPSATSEESE